MFSGRGCHGRLHPTHSDQDYILSLGEHGHTDCHPHADRHTQAYAHISADEYTQFVVDEAIARYHAEGLEATLAY